MALTRGSFQDNQPRNPSADADAAAPYASGSANRVDRESGVSNVAAQHTSSSSGESAIGDPFIESKPWTSTPAKQNADIPSSDLGRSYPNADVT